MGLAISLALPVYIVRSRTRTYGWDYYLRLYPLYRLFPSETLEAHEIGGVDVLIKRDRRSQYGRRVELEINRGWRTLYRRQDYWWTVESALPSDITADGNVNIVVHLHSGGAHCCNTYYVFEVVADRVRQLAQVDGEHGEAEFADIDGDGDLEIRVRDWTFAYWNASFAESPAPEIILTYDETGYRVAPNLMRKAAPSEEQMQRWVTEIRSYELDAPEWFVPPSPLLWQCMLDLLYNGNERSAWRLFDMAWPEDRPGKDGFAADFRNQLASSPFWRTAFQ